MKNRANRRHGQWVSCYSVETLYADSTFDGNVCSANDVEYVDEKVIGWVVCRVELNVEMVQTMIVATGVIVAAIYQTWHRLVMVLF